jgi:hypothetical protein
VVAWVADKLPHGVLEEEAQAIRQAVPKPFTVPEGWKPPTLGEQFRYVSEEGSRG